LRACLGSGGGGQSLVEFALVLPVLALLLTGVFWAGMNMCNYLALNTAVETGARYLKIVGNTTGNTVTNLADPCQAVFTQMMGSSSTLNSSLITVTYTLNGSAIGSYKGPYTGSNGGSTPPPNTCTNYSGSFVDGDTFTIVATYPCTAGMYGINLSSCQLTVSSPPNQVITSSNGT
jgi:Flp pilus assembly protein TadG